MAKNILVVCEKNLFRSKLLALFLAKELSGRKDVRVWSRGLAPSGLALPMGAMAKKAEASDLQKIASRVSLVAEKTGVPELLSHEPKLISKEDIEKADLILGVTDGVVQELKAKFPEAASRVFTAKRFAFPQIHARATARAAIGLEKSKVEKLMKKTGLSKAELISMPKSLYRIKSETQRLAKHIVRRL